MNHINFIEKRHIKLQFKKPELNYFWILITLSVIVLACALFSFIQLKRLDALQAKISNETVEVNALKSRKAASDNKVLGSKAVGDSQLNNPIEWGDLLNEVSKRIPDSVELVNIHGTLKDNRTLTLEAVTDDISSVDDLKESLLGFKWCERVDLVSLNREKNQEAEEQFQFQLDCLLK